MNTKALDWIDKMYPDGNDCLYYAIKSMPYCKGKGVLDMEVLEPLVKDYIMNNNDRNSQLKLYTEVLCILDMIIYEYKNIGTDPSYYNLSHTTFLNKLQTLMRKLNAVDKNIVNQLITSKCKEEGILNEFKNRREEYQRRCEDGDK